MANSIKKQQEILNKLNIKALNPMQVDASYTVENNENTIILSPTGTGKTLAFLLPLINRLDPAIKDIQALVLVPTRELAIQIEQVVRNIGSGFKVNAVYGGRPMSKDKIELKHNPAILIGTPGRILDHFDSDRFSKTGIKTLVLDEFDKSLEIGFEEEMSAILNELTNLDKRILTSATQGVTIPKFVNLKNPVAVNFLDKKTISRLSIETVTTDDDKLEALSNLLQHIGNKPGIIFCNFKNTIAEISEYLQNKNMNHECFYGGMEQKERERSLIKFRNGTSQILLATDLAARGIDIPELKYIIHYQLPIHAEEFVHRNGRTARVNEEGTAYILKWKSKVLPEFISDVKEADISKKAKKETQFWETLFISGGRKDKISKGDIAGLFIKKGGINNDQLGVIELKQDCAFVAVPKSESSRLINTLNNSRLKKKKVRITIL